MIPTIRKAASRLISSLKQKSSHAAAPGTISYSQCGEDLIIDYLFKLRGISSPSCLDIGAYHPSYSNNTYKFYLRGVRVINVDANPDSIAVFRTERPTDVNLNIGIGPVRGHFDFFIMEDASLNTFSVTEKDKLLEMGHRLKLVSRVEVVAINSILQQYFPGTSPDLLSIDAEGIDFEIIKDLNFEAYAPRVICIESVTYTKNGTGLKRTDLCSFIEQAGYVEYANTNINSIFVNKKWWFQQ